MPGSVESLLTLVLLVAGAWAVRWFLVRWRERVSRAEYARVEDTLKHLFHSEYRGLPATLGSLAGVLEIPRDRAAMLVQRCQRLGLAELDGDRPVLTTEGRAQALHVIRVHRLWEYYLAECTGVSHLEWHREAEQYEHVLTPAETVELEARLNHPSHDPHGDPIPTAQGQMPPLDGVLLTELPSGTTARILHVEDEPEAVYAQLVALELQPGVEVHVMDNTSRKIVFAADGRESVLAPVVAANITVTPPREAPEEAPTPSRTLAGLSPGQMGQVLRLAPACRGLERERLLDLGFVPGTRIVVQMRGPLGDPVAYRVRGATIALRREQAERVLIEDEIEAS